MLAAAAAASVVATGRTGEIVIYDLLPLYGKFIKIKKLRWLDKSQPLCH